MIVPALIAIALGLWHFTGLTTQATFTDLALARLYQTIALPFIFVTINTVAYVGLKPSQTGDASALLNVFRNVGGSVGISISQTILANGRQTHQSILTENANLLNPEIRDFLAQARQAGLDASSALGQIYGQIVNQAAFLAYLDVYRFVALLIIAVICSVCCCGAVEAMAAAKWRWDEGNRYEIAWTGLVAIARSARFVRLHGRPRL